MIDELLRQIGDLVLGSVPTIILFVILVFAYRFVLYGPLMRMLAERRERTLGAVEKAHAAIAAADAKSQEYEAKLRAARAEIFHRREQRMQEWNAQRERALAGAREAARERVAAARRTIEAEAAAARHQIEASADQLAGQILKAILPPETASMEGAR
ncbi:MAG: ATP synthase F0 subunit B [Silvibacterium sp.]